MPLTRAQKKTLAVVLPRIELPRIDETLPCRNEGDGDAGRKKKKLRLEDVYSDVEQTEDVPEEWQEEGEGGKGEWGKERDDEEEGGDDEECMEEAVEGGKGGKEADDSEDGGEECMEEAVEGGKGGKEADDSEEGGEEEDEDCMEEEADGRKEADDEEEEGGCEVAGVDSEKQGKKEKVRGKKRKSLSLKRAPRKSRGSGRHHHRKCPLCPMVVFNVPRHLRYIHQKTREESINLCKKVPKMEQHACPMPMCAGKAYTRINRHLVTFHGYKVGSVVYKTYKEKAEISGPLNTPYREIEMVEEVEEGPNDPKADEDHDSQQEDRESQEEEEVGKPQKAHRTLKAFYAFLTGVQGGLKNSKSAQQHCRQFELVWQDVSGRWARRDMMKPSLIQKRWLDVVLKEGKMQPGTILSYISSLKLWVRFTSSRGEQNNKLATALQGWAQSLKKTQRPKEKKWTSARASPPKTSKKWITVWRRWRPRGFLTRWQRVNPSILPPTSFI